MIMHSITENPVKPRQRLAQLEVQSSTAMQRLICFGEAAWIGPANTGAEHTRLAESQVASALRTREVERRRNEPAGAHLFEDPPKRFLNVYFKSGDMEDVALPFHQRLVATKTSFGRNCSGQSLQLASESQVAVSDSFVLSFARTSLCTKELVSLGSSRGQLPVSPNWRKAQQLLPACPLGNNMLPEQRHRANIFVAGLDFADCDRSSATVLHQNPLVTG